MYSGSTVHWICNIYCILKFIFGVKIGTFSIVVFSHIKYRKTHQKHICKCRISSSFRPDNLLLRNLHSVHHNMYICKACWFQKMKNHILHKLYTAVERGTLHFTNPFLYIYKEGHFGFRMCYRESKSGDGKCLVEYIEGWLFCQKCTTYVYILTFILWSCTHIIYL